MQLKNPMITIQRIYGTKIITNSKAYTLCKEFLREHLEVLKRSSDLFECFDNC